MRKYFLYILFIFIVTGALSQRNYHNSISSITINGTSNLHDWKSVAKDAILQPIKLSDTIHLQTIFLYNFYCYSDKYFGNSGSDSTKEKLDACGIDTLKKRENSFVQQHLISIPSETFIEQEIKNFIWKAAYSNSYLKTDILNKNHPT